MPHRPTHRRPPAGSARTPDVRAVAFCGLVVVLAGSLALVALVRRGPAARPDHAPWPMALSVADAHRALDALAVVQLAPEVAYDRTTDFGPAWADVDHNGCGTRDDVLRRDLTAVRTRPGTHGCVVVAGLLDDPYTGRQLAFSKSQADAIQIDHLIPLHAAWMLGAWQWTPERRLAYANDPRVLVTVDGPANQDKGDALADRWRPPNRRSWCAYAVNTVAIHADYGLGVTAPERSALGQMLERCAR
jgi:hypothetical protein